MGNVASRRRSRIGRATCLQLLPWLALALASDSGSQLPPVSGLPRLISPVVITDRGTEWHRPEKFGGLGISPTEVARDPVGLSLRIAERVRPGLALTESDLMVAATHRTPAMIYVHFRQARAGIPVLGSRITYSWKTTGELARFHGEMFAAVAGPEPTSVTISREQARRYALAAEVTPTHLAQWLLEELVWAPIDGLPETDWHLLWRFQVVTDSGFREIWVDARDGALLGQEELTLFETFSGTVTGLAEPRNPDDPVAEFAFVDGRVTLGDATSTRETFAGADGSFEFSDLPAGTYSLRSELAGPGVRIRDAEAGRVIPADSMTVSVPGQADLRWDETNARASLRDAFVHATRAYRFIRELDSGPSLAPLDLGIDVWVDDPALSCNAVWDGSRLKFYRSSAGCRATARIADVVYHEYGHAVTHHIYRPFTAPRDLHEAFSDYFAASLVDDPRVGLGLLGAGTFVRELATDRVWPTDSDLDPHIQGLILGGALWDLRTRLGATVADRLFHFSRYGLATRFDDFLLDLLDFDDDDADLSNGTPHFQDIIGAFRPHGIGDYSVRIEAAPIPDQEDLSAPIEAPATIHSLLGLSPPDLALYYRTESGAEFQRVPLVPAGSGRTYTARVQPPPVGSIVQYYWAAADTSGNRVTLPRDAPGSLLSFSTGPDRVVPEIEHTPLEAVSADRESVLVQAGVGDNSGRIESVRANVRYPDGRESTIDFVEESPATTNSLGVYSGVLPLEGTAGDTLWYSISATDGSSAGNQTTAPSTGAYGIAIRGGRFLDLELTDGGLGADGEWEWGAADDVQPDQRVWATRLAGPYANATRSTLEWGPIDIASFSTARLEFDHFYRFIRDSDGGRVEASDDRRSWQVLSPSSGYPSSAVAAFEGTAYTGNSGGWEHAIFPLDRALGDQIWIRWVAASDEIATDLGWYLDDLTIVAAQARVAPHTLRATSGEDREVPLTWLAPRGIEIPSPTFLGYRIDRARGQDEFVPLGETAATRYVDREVENEVSYRYRVHALYTEGLSPPAEVSATPAAPVVAFSIRSVEYTLRGGISASDTTFFVRNVGQGTLHFDTFVGEADWDIDDARIEVAVPQLAAPEVIAWVDPVDAAGNPDLARIGISQRMGAGDVNLLRVRLEGHFSWGDPTQSWGGVFLIDTDGNPGSGPESFGFGWNEDLNIGWEHAVVFGSLARELGSDRPALLYNATRLDQPVQLADVDFPENGREVRFGIPLTQLGDPEDIQIAVVLARGRQSTPFDRAPELPAVSWLKREPRHGRARLGQPQPLSFEFDARQVGSGDFAARVFLRTNDPAAREFTIPLQLHVRDVIPVEIPSYGFRAEAIGVRIDITLPIEPAAEGAIVERQDTRTQVWGAISAPLPPDPAGHVTYLDRTAEPQVDYQYRFRVRFRTGQVVVFGPYPVRYSPPRPERLELFATTANPSGGVVRLRLGLPTAAQARVQVFDIRGRRIRELTEAFLSAGVHPLEWDGRTSAGTRAAAGTYWVRADIGSETKTVRLTRLP